VSEVRITAEPRTEFGKGSARRTRRAGKLPAVLYGHGTAPRHISLPTRDFEHALRTDAGANVLLSLRIDGSDELALPKSIQRDPVRGIIEHVDLILVRRGEKITVDVPVVLTGDVVPGGLVDHQATTISVQAEATHLPNQFEVSIEGLEIGASVHAKELDLPEGTELAADADTVLVHILAAPTAEQIEAELAGAEAELGAGAAGAAAQEEAKAEAEGEAATEEPTGEGDVVPDAESGEGGPAEGQTPES
jgi:large subunit ribosomal protein L25